MWRLVFSIVVVVVAVGGVVVVVVVVVEFWWKISIQDPLRPISLTVLPVVVVVQHLKQDQTLTYVEKLIENLTWELVAKYNQALGLIYKWLI